MRIYPMIIDIKLLDNCYEIPAPKTTDAAGFDLYAAEDADVHTGEVAMVPTGVSIALPSGFCGWVVPRSGYATKYGVIPINAPGLVDPDYRGEIFVAATKRTLGKKRINRGDRIAQLVIMPYAHTAQLRVMDELPETERGANGFGHTGD